MKTKIILLFCLFLFFLGQFFFLSKRSQSFNFVDENEHLTPAYFMIKQGKKLYADLVTNHQPLPILTAYWFYRLVSFPNAFMLIERVRQFMLFFSFLGAFLLVWRFGKAGLLGVIFLETVKFYFFGYHLLAESLTVYPLMYYAGWFFEKTNKISPPKGWEAKDSLLLGFSCFWLFFNLLPVWPFLAVLAFFYWQKEKQKQKRLFILAFILPTFLLFLFIKPTDWFEQTVINNFRYFIPDEARHKAGQFFLFVLYPLLAFFQLNQPISRYYSLLVILTVVSFLFGLILKKEIKNQLTGFLFFLYFFGLLLNPRVSGFDISFYTAFHLLPQTAFLTMSVVSFLFFVSKKLTSGFFKKSFVLTTALICLIIFLFNTGWWREALSFDKLNEHFIQYGEDESIAMALAAIKKEGDTLLAGPQRSFINLFADIPRLPGKLLIYLGFISRLP